METFRLAPGHFDAVKYASLWEVELMETLRVLSFRNCSSVVRFPLGSGINGNNTTEDTDSPLSSTLPSGKWN
jgi:hypothetical protein